MKTIRINLKTCRFLLLLVFGWWSRLTFSCVRDGVGWNLEALGNPLTNEQTIQFVGTIEDEIWSNSSWWVGLCAFLWWFRWNLIGFWGIRIWRAMASKQTLINILMGEFHQSSRHDITWEGSPSQMYSWRLVDYYNSLVIMEWRDACWTGNGTSFQKV